MRHSLFLVVVALGLTAGCRKKGPPVVPMALRPAAEARKDLVVQFVLPSLQRTSASAGQVAQRLGLPFSAQDMMRTLAARADLPPGVFERIDLTRPVSVAAVVTGPVPGRKGTTAPVT